VHFWRKSGTQIQQSNIGGQQNHQYHGDKHGGGNYGGQYQGQGRKPFYKKRGGNW
jgi:hypothetical protein